MRKVIAVILVISIMLAGCTPKTETTGGYGLVPTREYLTIKEYVKHLNEDCDDLLCYILLGWFLLFG